MRGALYFTLTSYSFVVFKVNLIEPNIPAPKHKDPLVNPSIRLTDKNHVEWTKEIRAQKSVEISLKYIVEFPAQFDISLGR